MTVQFRDTYVDDRAPVLPLEDVYELYAAFAGVHKTDFRSLVNASDFSVGWTFASGFWSTASGLSGTGNSGAFYDVALLDINTSANYVLDVDLAADASHVALLFRANNKDNGYVVDVNSDGAVFKKLNEGAVAVLSTSQPLPGAMTLNGPGKLRLSVRETSFSGYDYDRWLFASLWMDDYLVGSMADNLSSSSPGYRVGIAVANGKTTHITRARIPDLADIVPFATLDPDETPMSAIQRATLERVVKMAVRWDGTLRAWQPGPVGVSQTFGESDLINFQLETDTRELFTRVRLYYGLSWVERFDDVLIQRYGHRYREFTNAVLETENDAYAEAGNMLLRSQENAFRSTLRTPRGGILLEPEDRIVMPDGKSYFLDGISMRWNRDHIMTDLQGRRYVYPE